MNRFIPLLASGAVLAGCSASGPVAKDARNTVTVASTNKPTPSANASGGPPAHQAPADPAPPSAATKLASALPAGLQGRWGMSPMDCTSTKGDAKGLLIIGPRDLHFYESRAIATADVQTDADTASGTFRFAGEGQQWTKYQALQVRKNLLTRTESNPTASFTYVKCS